MSDYGSQYTDEKTEELAKKIDRVYTEAYYDIHKKYEDFNAKFHAKDAKYQSMLQAGKLTQAQYDNWLKGQVFQGEQWRAKENQIVDTIVNANKASMSIINGGAPSVFGTNLNFMSYDIEKDAKINFGFTFVDENTVTRLLANNPDLLPKWKIDEPKDYAWNKQKVENCITQGIIQGESLDKIGKRLTQELCTSNENHMKTFARTAMTGAQNAGRLESLKYAEKIGIEVNKQWMATLDTFTRDSHADIDGESVPVKEEFSNQLMYPGDPYGKPAEVYNCRCTMVSDVKKYPAKYKRYNNEKGKPIQYMTYKTWAKSKSYGKQGYKTSQGGKGKEIDYSKYGDKEAFEIMQKYGSYKEFWDKSTYDEYSKVFDAVGGDAEIKQLMASKEFKSDVKAYQKQQETEALNNAKDDLKNAQDALAQIQQEIKDKGADTKFDGIWYNQTVTYADWEAKKDSVQSKIDYYENAIANTTDQTLINDYQNKIAQLEEFRKHGEEYSALLKSKTDAEQAVKQAEGLVKSLTPAPKGKGTQIGQFDANAYSQTRKDAAVWAKSPKEADDALRGVCGDVWKNATPEERDAILEYTSSYSKYNEPLRGWEYGQTSYSTGAGWKGVGNTDLDAGYAHNGERLNNMTAIIEKSTYTEDIWLQRGCDYGGMDSFFGISDDLLRNGTQEELESALLGTTPTEYGFMSCGSAKGQGFRGKPIMLNIYAPSGTKMMYAEPFSYFGNGAGEKWDGVSKQSSFGGELETILQQNTQFRVTKVEKSYGRLYIDLEVIAQNKPQLWKKTH